MKRFPAVAIALLLTLSPTQGRCEHASELAASAAFAVAAEVERIPAGSLWPGFDPASAPLAIFDGERTYLFRHPSPPADFEPVADRPEARVAEGQHSSVRANTSVPIGGVATATLVMSSGDTRSVRELASLAAHEVFHVFQAVHHPGWGGNEGDLFTYPVDDPSQLQLSRLEVEALRRALAGKRGKDAACWGAAALDARRRRFAALGERGAAYERGTELKEGLATLVQGRALGGKGSAPRFPKDEFSAGDVRSRSYVVGHALGALLDRFAPGWDGRLEQGAARPLDALLGDALAKQGSAACRFSRAEIDSALDRARRSIELARLTREAVRRDFLARDGWRLVFVAPAEPLSVELFDPLNVERLQPGEILHARWIKLGGSWGSIEVLDRRSLTESAGTHPLFEGVRRLSVTGILEEPRIEESAGTISIRASGVHADLRGARIRRENRTITVTAEPTR